MEEEFACGAAKEDITPAEELLPYLRGLQDRAFGGIIDRLSLRVIALRSGKRQVLLVSFELDKVPHPLRLLKRLEKEMGIPAEDVLLTAVHTHTAPVAGDRPFEGPNDIAGKPPEVQKATHRYEEFLEEKLIQAAKKAIESEVSARWGICQGESFVNVDRRQWYSCRKEDGRIVKKLALGVSTERVPDRTLSVLKMETPDKRPLAFLINFPVHCCVLHANQCFGGKMGISGDIAGRVSAWMEESYPGAVVMWCSGAAGNLNPVLQAENYYPDPVTGDVVTTVLPGDTRELLTVVAARHFEDVRRTAEKIQCQESQAVLDSCVEWSRTPGVNGEYEVRLHLMRIGDTALFSASGELYSVYAECLKDLLPAKHLIVINHDASLCANSGYILDDEALLYPETDLPGVAHTNMIPGYFLESLRAHARHMYEKIF